MGILLAASKEHEAVLVVERPGSTTNRGPGSSKCSGRGRSGAGRGPCGQYISNKRPSRFVILSGAKDLCPARDPSLRSEPALERSEGMTILHRLRLTRKTSYLKCIARKGCHYISTCQIKIDRLLRFLSSCASLSLHKSGLSGFRAPAEAGTERRDACYQERE